MKRSILTCFLLFQVCIHLYAQKINPSFQYVAAKSGLIIREQAMQTAKVMGKIPYGEKINLIDDDDSRPITIDGFNGKWVKVTYNNVTGYIANCFLLPLPPPAPGIARLEAYLDKISTPVGPDVTVTYEYPGDADALTKRLYKNGAEQHTHGVNEYASTITFLPYFTLQQAYLLVQLLQQYPEYVPANAFFPRNNQKTKLPYGELTVTVKKATSHADAAVTSIDLVYNGEGMGNYTLRFYCLDSGQAVIYYDEAL
ncbi:MAG TPA: SH3 domain-containing protein [Flavisolibacter sp.]|nr:SH3 domain-containing protein [Flavisolibacter sp.]